MSIGQLVIHYGYAAVLAGSLLEGETILLLAGIAAREGYLSYWIVVVIAFFGGALGDQMLFRLGRYHGDALMRQYPTLHVKADPVARLIRQHQNWLIVGVRFMYGLRLVGPFAIGMSDVSAKRFAVLNLIGAAVWATLVVGAGFLFGQTLNWLIADLGRYELLALLVAAAVVVLVLIVRWLFRRGRRLTWQERRTGRAKDIRRRGY